MSKIATVMGKHQRDDCDTAARPRPRFSKALAWLAGVVPLLCPFPGQDAAATEEASKHLRLCVDPSNLPFTSADPKTPGLYVEIGEAIGRAMGYSVAPVWNLTYFGKRALRTTLLAAKCDAAIGLPSLHE